jgi:DNA recombination protein RmuC
VDTVTIMLLAITGLLIALISLVLMKLNRGFGRLHNLFSNGLEQTFQGLGTEIREEGRWEREELRDALGAHQQALDGRLTNFARLQVDLLGALRTEASEGRTALEAALKRNMDAFSETQTRRLADTNAAMRDLADRLQKAQEGLTTQIKSLTDSNEKRQEAIRETLNNNLEQLRKDNEAKLEQMRATVDEKLQGTLETRLGESFKHVSERLEQVHRGLGEMQTLATGVGDLKRVLTNVKSRGNWGEVQLGMLLEDLLTADQYAKNVKIRPDSNEAVEFAVRLPGTKDGEPIFLPIDAKFPHEDYDRLLTAQESGQPDEVERAAQALERAVRTQARIICEKYVEPPYSTDFAIMYLATEGLFAEVVRRPGLCSNIQSTHRVMLTGPTTLTALLTSLQMGFRTLAIEKRSSEVWQVLGAAKAEFRKYGDVWDRLGKQLDTARNTVEEAGKRTRAVERRLKNVEEIELPGVNPSPLLSFDESEGDEMVAARIAPGLE